MGASGDEARSLQYQEVTWVEPLGFGWRQNEGLGSLPIGCAGLGYRERYAALGDGKPSWLIKGTDKVSRFNEFPETRRLLARTTIHEQKQKGLGV